MSKLELLKSLNANLSIFHTDDKEFIPFGRIVEEFDVSNYFNYMTNTEIPKEGNVYMASISEMEHDATSSKIKDNFFGGMDIQVGYCNGVNSTLNGLEYHKSSEINVACTDMVLLLGKLQDIANNTFSSENVTGFFVPKGKAVELYATTLHFAPCKVQDEGFKTVVILPKGTNEPLEEGLERKSKEDELLFMKNKWLLAHPERKVLMEKGAHPGINGVNIEIFYKL
ncbi:hypothetical protein FIU87_05800 [Bacillus sp. THAF10]|uniref:DUF4867 family protein n=1 Tax=Bacillus sp. THAF10 TaxID=2587848 RepID=UPI0012688171|nr:DUF4867 family protein [Bacillus sp. THAF10]QFT88146.1 hypothetical protein FIU87_05800 [Bacillus sp. THAF10]